MATDTLPVMTGVLRAQRRSLVGWSIALTGVTAMYVGLYPSMGGSAEMQALIDNMPDAMVTAFGYDRMGTAGGWLTSTIYGLLGPVLLLVFAIGHGARTIAGQEEDGTLELELTAPIARRRLLAERLAALWAATTVLVAVVTLATLVLILGLGMDVGVTEILAGSTGLLLLVAGFGTLALAVGAGTGRRGRTLAIVAGAAVLAFVFDAIGPTLEAGWMTAVSPFSWFLEREPLIEGFDLRGLALLASLSVVAAAGAFATFDRRDLGV